MPIFTLTSTKAAVAALAVACSPHCPDSTPLGGAPVVTQHYGKRIGYVEKLADGSTVMRGSFGRVEARAYPGITPNSPTRIEVRQ